MIPTFTILINESSENFIKQYPRIKQFKKNSTSPKTFQQKLFNYFLLNDEGELPIAAITALTEHYQAEEGWWLRADPVQLHADMSHVYLLGNQHLDFSVEEINQLITELNQFLKQDNLKLLTPQKNAWYLHLDQEPQIKTFPLPEVTGKVITEYLPQGEKSAYWQKLLTEIQMLLSMSEVNKKRKAENKAIINSLWFWGSGKLPQMIQKPIWQKVYGHDDLTAGLALLSKIPYEDFSEDVNFLEKIIQPGDYLLVINDTGVLAARPFLPLLFGRANGAPLRKINADIVLDFARGDTFEFNTKQLRPWWQRIF